MGRMRAIATSATARASGPEDDADAIVVFGDTLMLYTSHSAVACFTRATVVLFSNNAPSFIHF